MGRVRGARPRPRRQRQGRDRAGHPHRAHPDRRRGTRSRLRAGAAGVRGDRRQPGGRLHLGQLFGRGGRRVDPAGLRRGAFAVSRSRRRQARLQGERACGRGRKIPARRQGDRPRLLVARRRGRAGTPGERHRAGQAAVELSHRRAQRAAGRSAGEGRRARPSSTTLCRRASCMPACCGSRGAARGSLRSTSRRCGAPPRRRSTFCARAISSPSRRRARSP